MTKRRGHNEGSIRLRADGRWEAKISLPDGKRKSMYGKTRKEVQDKLRAAQRDLHAGLDIGRKSQTLAQFLNHWLNELAKPTTRPSTWTSYDSYIRNHIVPGIGHHRIADLTPQHVQAFLNSRSKMGLSPRTVTYIRAILRKALSYPVKWGDVQRNVAALTDAPTAVQRPVKPLSVDELRTFLGSCRGHWYWPLFGVAALTGLRQGELLGLSWNDVDLESGVMHVRHALQRIDGTPTLVEPKTDRSRRSLPLTRTAIYLLRAQRLQQTERQMFLGPEWNNPDDLVFTSTIGSHCNPSNVTHTFQKLLTASGLPRQRFHDLRHCNASLFLAAEVSARDVMEFLGHSQIALTLNTYSHVMPVAMRLAADRLDAFVALDLEPTG